MTNSLPNGHWVLDGADLEEQAPRTWNFPDASHCRQALGALNPELDQDLDRVYTQEHHVPVGDGRTLVVTEFFTLCSWLRGPRHAVLFLQGPVFQGNSWNIPMEGYDGPGMAARRGLFAFTVDYFGVARSYCPENGLDATFEANVAALSIVLKFIRFHRAVPKVALVAEGSGGSMATRLAADAQRISSCVLAAMLYKYPIGGPSQSPEFVALLTGSPNGYFSIPAPAYELFLQEAPAEVRDYVLETQPSVYPTSAMLSVAASEPPFFDPSHARAPGLVIFGEKDIVAGPQDPHELAADYGKAGAKLVTSESAGHAPRIESPAVVDWFWPQVFDFIDP